MPVASAHGCTTSFPSHSVLATGLYAQGVDRVLVDQPCCDDLLRLGGDLGGAVPVVAGPGTRRSTTRPLWAVPRNRGRRAARPRPGNLRGRAAAGAGGERRDELVEHARSRRPRARAGAPRTRGLHRPRTDRVPRRCRGHAHARGQPVLAVVVEVQLDRDPRKRRSWPPYLATLHARPGCLTIDLDQLDRRLRGAVTAHSAHVLFAQ